jgi:hypothetical protein
MEKNYIFLKWGKCICNPAKRFRKPAKCLYNFAKRFCTPAKWICNLAKCFNNLVKYLYPSKQPLLVLEYIDD